MPSTDRGTTTTTRRAPVAVPGVRDGGHRPVGQAGVAAQGGGGLPDAEDEAVRAAHDLDRALVRAGLVRGAGRTRTPNMNGPPMVLIDS
ncbi:hypothetical protein SVIOM342S_04477 [Streptomyces violaceorubidus]